ncbi:hypothetical protein SETIT_6G166600v2 [Setaria italica]|uniref:Uncharacterized protein n=1 Tax=Setaria italica TaxID=4555 RepID=A0A368RM80_SETIT|nr:hypothetical protein SETIT_6G166600v2 [Setaria italica]
MKRRRDGCTPGTGRLHRYTTDEDPASHRPTSCYGAERRVRRAVVAAAPARRAAGGTPGVLGSLVVAVPHAANWQVATRRQRAVPGGAGARGAPSSRDRLRRPFPQPCVSCRSPLVWWCDVGKGGRSFRWTRGHCDAIRRRPRGSPNLSFPTLV